MNKKKADPRALLFPMPAVLVGGRSPDNRISFATIAWAGVVNSDPPMLGVAIRKSRLTHELVSGTGQFSVNVPSSEQAVETDYCGIVSGRDADKAAKCGFTLFYGSLENAPLIRECPVNLACVTEKVIELPTHDYFIGRIEELYVPDVPGGEKAESEAADPLVFMGPRYARVTGDLGRPFSIGKQLGEKKG